MGPEPIVINGGITCRNGRTLDIQTPGEDRCLNLQISPEVRLLGVPCTPILTRYDWRILDV